MSATEADALKDRRSPTDYVCMYYEHQYDRMAQLEDTRLAVSNIVITLSVVALTFGFDSDGVTTLVTGIGLPFVMVVANLFAIAYIARSQSWMHTHRLRARRVLEVYAQDLYELDRTTAAPHEDW